MALRSTRFSGARGLTAKLLAAFLLAALSLAAGACTGDRTSPPRHAAPHAAPAATVTNTALMDFPDTPAVEDALPASPVRVLLLHDSTDTFGTYAYRQAAQALRQAKQPFDAYDLAARAEDSTSALPTLGGYAAVLTATEYLWKLSGSEAERLDRYVAGGGGLAVLHRAWHERLAAVWGTPDASQPSFRTFQSDDVALTRSLMPGDAGLTFPEREVSSYALTPASDAAVFLAAGDTPLAWRIRHGQGRVVYWNNALMAEKQHRGFATQSLALVQPRAVRPMAGWAAVFLDDFPAPAPEQKLEPIQSELGLSPATFYARRWWPDMSALAGTFGIRYTAAAVFSYNDRAQPPFPFDTWLGTRVRENSLPVGYTKWMSERLTEQGHELALHGYNHHPLTTEGFWPGQDAMEQSLRATLERWNVDSLAVAPRVYVPPMNQIDSTGTAALRAAAPSVGTLAGYYYEDGRPGTGRGFGPEPWAPSFFALPRNTSSYFLTDAQRIQMLSLLHTAGAWNHFLHPDEVYANEDRYRSLQAQGITPPPGGFRWGGDGGMYEAFREWLAFAREHYPWLRYQTATEATRTMQQYRQTAVQWTDMLGEGGDPNEVVVQKSTDAPLLVTLYAEDGQQLSDLRGGTTLHNGRLAFVNYFVVRMEAPTMTATFTSSPSMGEAPAKSKAPAEMARAR